MDGAGPVGRLVSHLPVHACDYLRCHLEGEPKQVAAYPAEKGFLEESAWDYQRITIAIGRRPADQPVA